MVKIGGLIASLPLIPPMPFINLFLQDMQKSQQNYDVRSVNCSACISAWLVLMGDYHSEPLWPFSLPSGGYVVIRLKMGMI